MEWEWQHAHQMESSQGQKELIIPGRVSDTRKPSSMRTIIVLITIRDSVEPQSWLSEEDNQLRPCEGRRRLACTEKSVGSPGSPRWGNAPNSLIKTATVRAELGYGEFISILWQTVESLPGCAKLGDGEDVDFRILLFQGIWSLQREWDQRLHDSNAYCVVRAGGSNQAALGSKETVGGGWTHKQFSPLF